MLENSPNSHAERILSLFVQSKRQSLLRHAPNVSAWCQTDNYQMLDAFYLDANNKSLSMNWALPIHFLNWLKLQRQSRSQITQERVQELLVAAVIRWSLQGLEHIEVKGILVASCHLPKLAVGLWKSNKIEQASRVVLVQLSNAQQPEKDSYALANKTSWAPISWLDLPF